MVKYINRLHHFPNYKIVTDCEFLLNTLQLQFGKYLNDSNDENAYQINITYLSDEYYHVTYGNQEIVTYRLLSTIEDILFNTTTYDKNIVALHGSAVSCNGFAYIFLAPTNTGKTTLTSYLAQKNLAYITEDCILIDKTNFTVHPYTCPIHLRQGGIEVLQKHGIEIPNMSILEDIPGTRYVYTPDNCVEVPVPLGKIFFISRSGTENYVEDMSVSESIAELMKSATTVINPTGEYIRDIISLAKRGCKKLVYSDMEYVYNTIMKEKQYE